MEFSLNSHDLQVIELLKAHGIGYSVMYQGAVNGEWNHDAFKIVFSSNSHTQAFEFKTGAGRRYKPLRESIKSKNARKKHQELTGIALSAFKVELRQGSALMVPAPTAANVLYSLLLDSQALDTSFKYWCGNFGYSDDSVEAFNIYKECCENAAKLNTIFNRALKEQLNEILQDY